MLIIISDASDVSLGAAFYQNDVEGQQSISAYASRSLNHTERNYHIST